ncbi:MAG TPA: glycosyltransferase [Fimbriimonadaceae bacterium]|nr:glycosyltransferase [Fimbriimonadaceae bacterium]
MGKVEVLQALRSLPEHTMFVLFTSLHIYLYLHAELASDLSVDVTKMARDRAYRAEVEEKVRLATGLSISLADVTERTEPSAPTVGPSDWAEVREHVRLAVRLLSRGRDPATLWTIAAEFLDAAHAETVETKELGRSPSAPADVFRSLAPFLCASDSPSRRRELSEESDGRIVPQLVEAHATAALPQINCFYEVISDGAAHSTLVAAVQSMRRAGHPVRVWTYSPAKLDFLARHGVELGDAAEVIPKELFDRIVARSEIRYFSDIFRYAVLYERGGLWMDADVVMLRPFPFRGEFFFNLQWHDGGWGHFVCGNVMYAEPCNRHMRALYDKALERSFAAPAKAFGDVGPKLLSDYIASAEGAPLRRWVFSPMFFNSIDWTEVDRFERPIRELADYLRDERVVGVHLWNAKTHSSMRETDDSLIGLLSDPEERMPSLSRLAERFETDKNRHTGNRHAYARVYDRLLGNRRLGLRRIVEIGPYSSRGDPATQSVALWQSYFPYAHVVGVNLRLPPDGDASRFTALECDQSQLGQIEEVASAFETAAPDAIIDDGSHASSDQQLTLSKLWSSLASGGWYFIEDLDWQPSGEEPAKVPLTKTLLRELEAGRAPDADPFGIATIASQFANILFFDSHYELCRAGLTGGLVAIRKRSGASA